MRSTDLLKTLHKSIHNFFLRRREGGDFRKSIGIILLHTIVQVISYVYFEIKSSNSSIFIAIAWIPAGFLISFASWALLSGLLFLIARLFRYPARIEVVILLTAYGYLPIAFGNLLIIFLRILNLNFYLELTSISIVLSVIMWIYAVKVGGE